MTCYAAQMIQRQKIIAAHMDDVIYVPTSFESRHNGKVTEKTSWQWWVGSEDMPANFEGAQKFWTSDGSFNTKAAAQKAYKAWRAGQ